MILPGNKSNKKINNEEVAKLTLKCLKDSVPKEVPGIAFLSGGQTEIEATENLNLINKFNDTNFIMSYSYGRALQQSAIKFWSKDIKILKELKKSLIIEPICAHLRLKENGQKNLRQNRKNKRFIYLISPNKIKNEEFYTKLNQVLSSKKVSFFQLRLKKENIKNKIYIGKKIKKICKKYQVKFLINDDPIIAKKVNADGCHLGQKDMNILNARKILKNKIIGITCHNSINLAKKAISSGANYLAFGAFLFI